MLLLAKKLLGVGKKVFLVLFTFSVVITLFTYFSAQGEPVPEVDVFKYNQDRIYKVINDPELNTSEDGKSSIALYRYLTCSLIGEGCTAEPTNPYANFNNSLIGSSAKYISFPYVNPPASGIAWTYNGLQNAGFVPKTFAAEGIGFSSIKPLTSIWKIFRDMSYILLVLVLIAIGFMVMFRMNLGAETVITVESALPRIVIALILITFSFAIAGFLIDLMYVTIAISVSMIMRGSPNLGMLQNQYLSATPALILESAIPLDAYQARGWQQAKEFFPLLGAPMAVANTLTTLGGVAFSLLSVLPPIVSTLVYMVGGLGTILAVEKIMEMLKNPTSILENIGFGGEALTFGIQGNLGKLVSGFLNTAFMLLVFAIIGSIAVPILMIITMLATVFYLFFRVFFMLLTTYLKILLYIVLAPLFMLMEVIPGQDTFKSWFTTLFAEIFTFPVVIVLFLVANRLVNVMLAVNINSVEQGKVFWSPPFLYGLNQEAYAFLVGMGIVFLIPDIVKLYKDMLGVKPAPLNVGLNTFFAGGSVAVGGALGLGGKFSALGGTLFGENVGVAGIAKKLGVDVPDWVRLGRRPKGGG